MGVKFPESKGFTRLGPAQSILLLICFGMP
jgi:hypothetical protein